MLSFSTPIILTLFVVVGGHSSDSSDSSEEQYSCSRSTLMVINSGLANALSVTVDGQTVKNQKIVIKTGSSVLAAQFDKGMPGRVIAALALTTPFVRQLTCTNTTFSNSSWTAVSYNDSAWPLSQKCQPSSKYLYFLNLLRNAAFFLRNSNRKMSCRFHLVCGSTGLTTTTAKPTTSSATKPTTTTTSVFSTRPSTTSTASQSPTPTSTTTTTRATTTTTTTTTVPMNTFPTTDNGLSSTTPVPNGTIRIYSLNTNGTIIGGTLTPLECLVEANPDPNNINWSCSGFTINSSLVKKETLAPGWTAYTYTPVEYWDASKVGTCTCSASSVVGSDSVTVQINIPNQSILIDGASAGGAVQLSSDLPNIIILQATSCAGLKIELIDTNGNTPATILYVVVDGVKQFQIQAGTLTPTSSLPSGCNVQGSVWFWIAYDSASLLSFGTGPIAFTNTLIDLTIDSVILAWLQLGIGSNDVTSITYYVYE